MSTVHIYKASAGSGKTYKLVQNYLAYVLQPGHYFDEVLAITFTNKAAKEMRERIGKLVDQNEARNLWMGTFHSVFARILRVEAQKIGYPSNFSIYDTDDSKNVVKQIICS